MKHVLSFLAGALSCALLGLLIWPQVHVASKPWFDIPEPVKQKIRPSVAKVTAGRNNGSGCEVEPGSGIYLTSLHIIAAAILDDESISVNGKPAKVIERSKTKDDFAVVTTNQTVPKYFGFEPQEWLADGQNIIIAGNPANLENFIQPGKTMDAAKDENRNPIPGAQNFSAQLTEVGISGGCVFLEDGTGPVGVITKKYNIEGSSMGIMTLVKKAQRK